MQRDQDRQLLQVPCLQVRRFAAPNVIARRRDQHDSDAVGHRTPRDREEVLPVAREWDAPAGLSVAMRPNPVASLQVNLHDAEMFGGPHFETAGMHLAVGRTERVPVVVPTVLDDEHARVKRQHVTRQLRAALLTRPAGHAQLCPRAE